MDIDIDHLIKSHGIFLLMEDEMVECSRCSSRTWFDEIFLPDRGEVAELHTCRNPQCQHQFVAQFDEEWYLEYLIDSGVAEFLEMVRNPKEYSDYQKYLAECSDDDQQKRDLVLFFPTWGLFEYLEFSNI